MLEAFPGRRPRAFPYLPQLSVCVAPSPHAQRICLLRGCFACPGYSVSRSLLPSPSLPRSRWGTGISTRRPSDTPFGLSLGPDLPGADQLYPGNLGYSAARILTLLSLLIPAFSLLNTPRLLTVPLRCVKNAPLPTFLFPGFGVVFQPRTFSAQDLSTSELLRTL